MQVHYASFDAFPTSKGASTHIYHTVKAMEAVATRINVYCLKGKKNSELVFNENTYIHHFYYSDKKENYLKKASLFSEKVFQCMEVIQEKGIAQFRDVWSGLGMINRPNLKTIFEVNALTSLELPVRYPLLTENFIQELEQLENKCLQACDHIITPSVTTKKYLINKFQINSTKITVIPNGAETTIKTKPVNSLPSEYLIYFGALQPWQGVDVLIKACKYLEDYPRLKLIICSSVKEKFNKAYQKLIQNCGLEDKVLFFNELDKESLYYLIKNSKASIAPLKFGERNVIQGCCPIKILETLACNVPLVVSDLPVIRELVDEKQAIFFDPEDERDLSRCLRFVLDNPEKSQEKANLGYQLVINKYTWQHHNNELQKIYSKL